MPIRFSNLKFQKNILLQNQFMKEKIKTQTVQVFSCYKQSFQEKMMP